MPIASMLYLLRIPVYVTKRSRVGSRIFTMVTLMHFYCISISLDRIYANLVKIFANDFRQNCCEPLFCELVFHKYR